MNCFSKDYFCVVFFILFMMSVIQQNQKYYEAHCNKYFIHWDLVNCPIPTHFINKCQKTKIVEHFDLMILKDVIQHVSAKDGQKMLKNIVSSGAKYLILSSYPCDKTKVIMSHEKICCCCLQYHAMTKVALCTTENSTPQVFRG